MFWLSLDMDQRYILFGQVLDTWGQVSLRVGVQPRCGFLLLFYKQSIIIYHHLSLLQIVQCYNN